jgi:transcriptional regulator with GAF, ATPase, and Fis domain
LRSLEAIQTCAFSDAAVLVSGETGTGKELAARAIHYLGSRRDYPFIPVNCGAIPDHIAESELFGHVRGAFTDARETRQGLVAAAHGGTLFLDEIEAMSPRMQAVLLRFLQDQEYRPVGSNDVRKVDVRIIAATNVDLHDLVDCGQFRKDILYRLNLLSIVLPPLRQRGDDVVLLAETFIERLNRKYQGHAKYLDPDCTQNLEGYGWPGNVRELENLIHREFLMTSLRRIHIAPVGREALRIGTQKAGSSSGLPLTVQDACSPPSTERRQNDRRQSGPQNIEVGASSFCVEEMMAGDERIETYEDYKLARERMLARFEEKYLTTLMSRAAGNVSLAARLSGRDRSDLCKLLKKYGLDKSSFRSEANGFAQGSEPAPTVWLASTRLS